MLPDHAWWRDRGQAAPPSSKPSVAYPRRIGEPQVRVPQVASEAGDVIGARERDDRDPASPSLDLVDVVPQLREVLLAVDSTEVTEQDQDRRGFQGDGAPGTACRPWSAVRSRVRSAGWMLFTSVSVQDLDSVPKAMRSLISEAADLGSA